MIRTTAFLAFAVVALPVLAQDKPAWDAELWSMEEGEMLVASVTSVPEKEDELVPTLALMCGGDRQFRLRYDPGPQPDDTVDWTGQSATFEFSSGQEHIERELQFEAMDGMWATSVASDDPLIGAIEAGDELLVLMPSGGLSENTFSLKGSSAAIAEMRKSC
jgi:hypothetical protein